ncbi:hypothetical protein [Mesorhizobium sp. WSM3859]|uniref:hypothetical protein n=1 Tax=Mesorhizobium sp. WSM3859 TaxID=2029402 RepID=UPI001AECE40E|nr:hypothetical protein [Mesorhizobium sp. WSM3859]
MLDKLREQEERHAELLRQTQEVIAKSARLVRASKTLLSRPTLHDAPNEGGHHRQAMVGGS